LLNRVEGIADERVQLDATEIADRVAALQRSIARDFGDRAVELYHRETLTLRVAFERDDRSPTVARGHDRGLAVRVATPTGREVGFASASGAGGSSLRWALARCREQPPGVGPQAIWARGAEATRLDLDGPAELPPLRDVVAWLERARDGSTSGGRPASPAPVHMSVEVAASVENWFADGGLRGTRTRIRGWALIRTREPWAHDPPSRPAIIARRRWQDLPEDGWSGVLEDRRLPAGDRARPPGKKLPVIFSPECSGQLVVALFRALHLAGHNGETEVGPAWRVTDDPGHPRALSGGSFDDAGFATRSILLADGRRTLATLEGAGHFRRPSFRDRPTPMHSHLVVAPSGGEIPDQALLCTALDVHAVQPDRWILRLEGALCDHGRPGALLQPSYLSVSPEDLVRRCVATLGPARLSHHGVETPALLFVF